MLTLSRHELTSSLWGKTFFSAHHAPSAPLQSDMSCGRTCMLSTKEVIPAGNKLETPPMELGIFFWIVAPNVWQFDEPALKRNSLPQWPDKYAFWFWVNCRSRGRWFSFLKRCSCQEKWKKRVNKGMGRGWSTIKKLNRETRFSPSKAKPIGFVISTQLWAVSSSMELLYEYSSMYSSYESIEDFEDLCAEVDDIPWINFC